MNRAKIEITLNSCGGCPFRSEVYYDSGDNQHYSFCCHKDGKKVVAVGPPWSVPDNCPCLVKEEKK